MVRKNPNEDAAKKAFNRLYAEILRHGEKGESDLEDLFHEHPPDVIFALEPGPDRQARAAQLLGEMRSIAQGLARERYQREGGSETEGHKVEARRRIRGTHARFSYVIVELPDGRWGAKITKQGRQIIPHPEAPKIIDSPDLKKRFKDPDDAELAIRRVINTALIWYAERNLSPSEKVRKTERGRAGIVRRTAGQVEARLREKIQDKLNESEEKRREKIREERRKKKVQERVPKTKEIKSPGRGRKLVYIPKNNPSHSFSFSHSNSSAAKHGNKRFQDSMEWIAQWNNSLKEGKPNFKAALKAYDNLENARANFLVADENKLADKVDGIRKNLRSEIIKHSKNKTKKRIQNPSAPDHNIFGEAHMDRAGEMWKIYEKSRNIDKLIDAYKHLELSQAEFKHADNLEGIESAKARIDIVRDELKNRIKG